jgi:serine protease Do
MEPTQTDSVVALKSMLMKTVSSLLLATGLSFASASARENPRLEVSVDTSTITATKDLPVVSYADVLDKATPSVVAVYSSRIVTVSQTQSHRGIEELFRQFGYPPQRPAVPDSQQREQRERLGVGSGVIVSVDGYIITNNHVVQDDRGEVVDEIRVRLSDNREFVAELIGSDEKTDVAVLKIDTEDALPAVTLADSGNLRVGDIVFAIGNPLDVGLTATQGIVSAIGRNSLRILGNGAYENFIQTDASINLGNSGGALIDAWGRLIGINTAISSGSGGSIGIGFAIPANMVLNVMTNLIETGEVPRGLLGLLPENLTPDLADAFELPSTRGALVNQVQLDSPAERAGILHGDIITYVDSIEIESAPQLRLVISQMQPGRTVDVKLIRAGKTLVLPVVLGSLNGKVASVEPMQNILEGVYLESLDSETRKEMALPKEIEGVLVSRVSGASPYAETIVEAMIILEVNGEAVENPTSVAANLQQGVNRFYVWSQSIKRFVVIRVP